MQPDHKPTRVLAEPSSHTGCWVYILWLHKVVPAHPAAPENLWLMLPASSTEVEHGRSLSSKHVWLVPSSVPLDLRGTPGEHPGPHLRSSVYGRLETDLVEKQRDQGPEQCES
jgi:hypothetical protein